MHSGIQGRASSRLGLANLAVSKPKKLRARNISKGVRARDMPIRSTSRRSLTAAMKKARLHLLSEPNSVERVIEVGDHLLQLLVLGIDCNIVGSGAWYSMILNSALSDDLIHQHHGE
jgi:hypothetical protein